MLCTKCKERPAVVFVQRPDQKEGQNEGYCMRCARELNIGPINQMLERFGIGEEELDQMEEQMTEMMELAGESAEGEDFSPGGAPSFPFLQNLFGPPPPPRESAEEPPQEGKGKKSKKKPEPEKKRKFLDTYCTNLTARAKAGQVDPTIGRDREIYRVTQILSRRSKNNPCLIGEPGVGKTAIAEGLASRIARGEVPPRLRDKEVHLLDLTALVAGTQFRGQFESRIKGLVDEVRQAGNVILFIDEVHNLVGTGDAEGSMSAANILKPALSRGEIQVIGATTFNEYRKHIEKDAALERRFQPVTVEEPSLQAAYEILLGVRPYYEAYHGVTLSAVVLRQAVTLSERYITDRFLPDKAIDLLDEACAATALANKKADEYADLQKELARLGTEEEEAMAEETIDYEKLSNTRAQMAQVQQQADAIRPEATAAPVGEEALAKVIELWTGIPASKVQESELGRLAKLEDHLRAKIIGQEEAVTAVSAAIRRSRVQLSPRRRPASFIFVGSTGVGKTELVKVLAAELFDTPETLIRLDMSEFMEKHAVSRIIGSPPGYVGYDEAGQLTEKVRRKPYSVILLDEIEKAHPDVLNILLQILDEGRVTDAHGRVVNFENTVIVMTSNAGSNLKDTLMGFGQSQSEAAKEKAVKALSDFLRPEFIGRVDEVVFFRPLSVEDFRAIAGLMLTELREALTHRGIALTWSEEALTALATAAHGGKRGARDLRNVIRRQVEDALASEIVARYEIPPQAVSIETDAEGGIRLNYT
ncbi:MAG: ATP-dependent Clp protease ATP-binding subunit [Ruminococcaceae bacterium]|nr:ATP-dependent Clp protease ATP-binding subunit [Oscillospiraceae bacterium]